MDLFVFLPVFFLALVIFFVILFVMLASHRRVEQPGIALSTPAPGPYGGYAPVAGSAAGQWNGEILGTGAMGAIGGTLGSTFGVFEVRGGHMVFTPDDAAAPTWTTPCNVLTVAKRGLLALNGADVSISWPTGPGVWHTASCNVSREKINRFMENDFKDMRERGYADEFIACLAANGARVNP
jgi:hypothetical protein